MRVLIVGAGIGGPTLAYWLSRAGHQATLLERAPGLRGGGYLLDFWGAAFDVAERMGIVPVLFDKGYVMTEMREVDEHGERIASIDPSDLIGLAGGRYVTIARADLASAISSSLDAGVETIFGDTVTALRDDGVHVTVDLQHGGQREFDLVIGADGQHSSVRRLAFGPDERYQRDLGIAVAAFDIEGYLPRNDVIVIAHTDVGVQALRFALRDGATMFLITFRLDGPVPEDDVPAQQELLRQAVAGIGGEVAELVQRLPEARTFYFDKALQIRMPSWSRGRVALIGDAAAAPSLLAGQGSALAMIGAYTLASELDRAGGDPVRAFAAYEKRLSRIVLSKQNAAVGLGVAFAPRNRAQLRLRNLIMRTMAVPFIARLVMGRSLRDQITLPPPAGG